MMEKIREEKIEEIKRRYYDKGCSMSEIIKNDKELSIDEKIELYSWSGEFESIELTYFKDIQTLVIEDDEKHTEKYRVHSKEDISKAVLNYLGKKV